MSQYGVIYRLRWKTAQNDQTVTVNIYDTEVLIDDSDTPVVNTLIPSADPLLISTINNNKAKYGIFSKQAKIEFISTVNYNAYTFADSKDNRWLVVADNGTDTIFKGFLVLTDITRPFLPNPNVITLTASDNLGLLKEKDLKTDADETPTGKNRIADYLTWALAKTGLSLQIKTTSLVKHGTSETLIDFANFSNPSSTIFFPLTQYPQFYLGQRIQPSTGLNSATVFTVVADNNGFNVEVTPAPVHESGLTNFTLTDVDSGHVYDTVYLDAKTFEAEIGECEDCYTVLEKILDKDAFLVQHNGAWWIMRPDDFDGEDLWVSTFDTDGSFLDDYTQTDLNKSIGETEDQRWTGAIQAIEYERPYNFAKHTFRYENPAEVPCNINYERGDLITTVSATQKHFELDCWDKFKVGSGSGDPADTDIYIRRIYINGAESERFIVFEVDPSWHFIMSEGIPVLEKDRCSFNADFAISSDKGGSGFYRQNIAQLRLYGNDGTYWTHAGITSANSVPSWVACTSSFNTNQRYHVVEGDASEDQREYKSLYSGEVAPVPVDGTIKILLYCNPEWGDTDDTYITNISFTYNPFINGSYELFQGQSSKYSRSASGYSAKIDEEVSVSDSPKPIIKGSMFVLRGTSYELTNTYHNQHPTNTTPADSGRFMPYEKLRVLANWNQYRISTGNKGVRYFTGDIYGLSDYLDMINPVLLTDADTDASNRVFMVLSLEQDWRSCITNIKLVQTAHDDGKVIDDDFEFKYITE